MYFSLICLWTVSIASSAVPLFIASDRPIFNQRVLIKRSLYFTRSDVEFDALREYALKLFTFHPNLKLVSGEKSYTSYQFENVINADSWYFMESFLNNQTGANFRFELFKG